ncbi:MAG: hypothetical protein M0031_12145 [Thermaerobacter sp.]|jgi:hypothetical protein|nr:hypothetical protein [Thermaerobacter sp.]
MMDRRPQIGFSQRIRLEWLEQTAYLLLAGNEAPVIPAFLQDLLRDQLSKGGTAIRGNREKAVTVLMRTWVRVEPELICFRDAGFDLLRMLPPDQHIAVHWGMTMAAYPFFGVVAENVGKLLRLQENVAAAQVQRRIQEGYGERETVSRATRRVLRTFVDWGVLRETFVPGVYGHGKILPIMDHRLAAWLVEAVLRMRPDALYPLRAAFRSPHLFPFRLERLPLDALARSERMELIRHGLDDDLLVLRKLRNSSSTASDVGRGENPRPCLPAPSRPSGEP